MSAQYLYRSCWVDGRARRVYIGRADDEIARAQAEVCASLRKERADRLAMRREVLGPIKSDVLAIERAVREACVTLKAGADSIMISEGFHRPKRDIWRARRVKTKTSDSRKSAIPPVGESALKRACRGDETAAAEVAEQFASSPEAVRKMEALDRENAAVWVIQKMSGGMNPAMREARLAVFRRRCVEYAGSDPTAVASALACRAALAELELEAAEDRIRDFTDHPPNCEEDDDEDEPNLGPSARGAEAAAVFDGVMKMLEGRREISERRFMTAMRSLADARRVYAIVHIHEAEAKARGADRPSLAVVG